MKKFKSSFQQVLEATNQKTFKLKRGITWKQMEHAKKDGTFKFEEYFEEVKKCNAKNVELEN